MSLPSIVGRDSVEGHVQDRSFIGPAFRSRHLVKAETAPSMEVRTRSCTGSSSYDQSYFTKRFRKATGMTPRAYRKHFRKNQGTPYS